MKTGRKETHLTRRILLKSVAAASALGTPALAGSRSIKIGSYGGYFEDSFKKHLYPAFTAATGIEVESITQPNSSDWLVTMQQAAIAGRTPTDLSLFARDALIKGSRIEGLLAPINISKISSVSNLDPYFLFEGNEGVLGVGVASWFVSMVVNPDEVKIPESWAELWDDPAFESSLGFSRLFNSNLLDIVAATFFPGQDAMLSRDGLVACIEKAAEIRPNVALWWSGESQMEQAMKNRDVIGGMYYHDVAIQMAAEGFPIQSVFPKEGNPHRYGSWCLSPISLKTQEAQEFIAFTSEPATQALMSRTTGTAPLVEKSMTDLSDQEFAAVSGTPTIQIAYEAYLDEETFIKESWDRALSKA